ncbi:MAG: 16S rRNA (uracil(1498)-N(3))-methyltransferase [Clostridia bacterium]|nr:16S rRNA (uracil(1498)-N(3))-methyltransferase [Clostridia bacterium]
MGRAGREEALMHTFFAEGDLEGAESALLTEEESRHAGRVLRLRAGEEVVLADGRGHRWLAVLGEDGPRREARLVRPLPDNEPRLSLTVCQGLPKADKLEWIVQKLTELGCARVVPVEMARSVPRERGRRAERLERIAREAVKQCRRARVPEVTEVMSWRAALEELGRRELVLVPWEEAEGTTLAEARAAHPDVRDLALVIGPEGGIDQTEILELKRAGGLCVTLGPRILRTETAAIAAAAAVMTLWGEM